MRSLWDTPILLRTILFFCFLFSPLFKQSKGKREKGSFRFFSRICIFALSLLIDFSLNFYFFLNYLLYPMFKYILDPFSMSPCILKFQIRRIKHLNRLLHFTFVLL